MVSVRIFSKTSGKPLKNMRVCIGFSGFTRGFSPNLYSDNNGEVHFNNDPGEGSIYVNGKEVYKGTISGMRTIYLND